MIKNSDGWTVCNGYQAMVGPNLKEVLKQYVAKEQVRVKKAQRG